MKAIFAGTFDPFTEGHYEILKKATALFDDIVVAVAADTGKRMIAPIETRLEIAGVSVSGLNGVRVAGFGGLLTDFMKNENCVYLIRGLRNTDDFSYEQNLAEVYKRQYKNFEEIYFISAHKYMCVSGTIVRELVRLDGNLDGFVIKQAQERVRKAYKG